MSCFWWCERIAVRRAPPFVLSNNLPQLRHPHRSEAVGIGEGAAVGAATETTERLLPATIVKEKVCLWVLEARRHHRISEERVVRVADVEPDQFARGDRSVLIPRNPLVRRLDRARVAHEADQIDKGLLLEMKKTALLLEHSPCSWMYFVEIRFEATHIIQPERPGKKDGVHKQLQGHGFSWGWGGKTRGFKHDCEGWSRYYLAVFSSSH